MLESRRGLQLRRAGVVLASVLAVAAVACKPPRHRAARTAATPKPSTDPQLVTAVRLIELHKLRYGEYPAALSDIRFRGLWDFMQGVRYCRAPARDHYFVSGPAQVVMPDAFWKGTGYISNPSLCAERG